MFPQLHLRHTIIITYMTYGLDLVLWFVMISTVGYLYFLFVYMGLEPLYFYSIAELSIVVFRGCSYEQSPFKVYSNLERMSIIPPNSIRSANMMKIPISILLCMCCAYHSALYSIVSIQMPPTAMQIIAIGINLDGFIL